MRSSRHPSVLDECSHGADFVRLMSTDKSRDQLQTKFQQHYWGFSFLETKTCFHLKKGKNTWIT